MDQQGLFGRSDAHASIQSENAGWRSSIAFPFLWIPVCASSMQTYTPTQPTPSHNAGEIPSYRHPSSRRAPLEYLDSPANRFPPRRQNQDHLFAFGQFLPGYDQSVRQVSA
jgi:hypothetical protein